MIINDENYEAVVAEGKPMMLDFWATWCGPCKKIGPDIEALAQEYEGQVIVKQGEKDYTLKIIIPIP